MIYSLTGTIKHKGDRFLVLEVHDIGYQIFVNDKVWEQSKVGGRMSLFIHQYIREDAWNLYGFVSEDERELFNLLLSVTGIGPKSAWGILNIAAPAEIKAAIAYNDASVLTRVSGIGKKTAERIVLELKSKFSDYKGIITGVSSISPNVDIEAIDALVGLGYSESQARHALARVPSGIKSAEEKIKAALKEI